VYILDRNRFEKALRENGYTSIGDLAKDLGVHRNTLHHYLSGQGVFPSSLEKMFQQLRLKPEEILIQSGESHSTEIETIAPLVDKLQREFPEAAFVLFGSRTRETSKKYSDWDIGVFCEEGLDHDRYRKMRRIKEEIEDSLPYIIDLVNFNQADDDFMEKARKGWLFLGGSLKSWMALNRKVAA